MKIQAKPFYIDVCMSLLCIMLLAIANVYWVTSNESVLTSIEGLGIWIMCELPFLYYLCIALRSYEISGDGIKQKWLLFGKEHFYKWSDIKDVYVMYVVTENHKGHDKVMVFTTKKRKRRVTAYYVRNGFFPKSIFFIYLKDDETKIKRPTFVERTKIASLLDEIGIDADWSYVN